LTLACELARYGLSYRIVDQAEAPAGIPKAVGVQSRTLEALDIMGLAEQFLAHGHRIYGFNLYAKGQRLAHVALDGMPTRYSYMLTIPQSETERLLTERLDSLGGRVERPVRFTGLKQEQDGVSAMLDSGAGTETVRARWLVGCDGAHSGVRHALDLPFEGSRYEESFLLAYARIETDLPTDEVHAFFTPEGPVAVLPLPLGRHYLILPLLKSVTEEDRTAVSLEEVTSLLTDRGLSNVRMIEPIWLTKFRIHRRIAGSLRVGRIFLCGDAAHIHSPAGGQGMNLGIQDAFNLAWKLVLVQRGVGKPVLLDSYHPERHPIAEAVLSATDLATKAITLRNPVAQTLRNQIATFLSSFDVVQHRLTESVAGMFWNYRRSPIVAEHRAAPVGGWRRDEARLERAGLAEWRDFGAAPPAGDRAPDGTVSRAGADAPVRLYELLRTPRHTLLLFDGEAATAAGYRNLAEIGRLVQSRYGDLIAVHIVVPAAVSPSGLPWEGSVLLDADAELHHRYGAGSECLYVIRPDGYVGYRSQPADEGRLLAYLERIFT
jgi:2-polyprenyl-6-methoxyphenol hydroxylase-like FAD-dependent oxidoreductase